MDHQHARVRRRAVTRDRFARTHTMKATLALENGLWYEGEAVGAHGETGGEVVFNTSLTGYQEILTDPVSYTHLRAHETPEHLVCRLLLEKKKKNRNQ